MAEQKQNKVPIKKDSVIFISAGIILILLSVLFDTVNIVTTENKALILINTLFIQFLSHIGIGCLAVGIISIAIDMDHWTSYFEARLSNVITKKGYLERLDEDLLAQLETEILKAYFKNDDIGGADGFLKFYQKNIQGIFGMPFRVNVGMDMDINYNKSDASKVHISETLSYTCMANAGKIQDKIRYLPEPDQHCEIKNYEVLLQHEKFKNAQGDSQGVIQLNYSDLVASNACDTTSGNLILDISEYNENGLMVVVKIDYSMELYRFFSWRMSHPSREVQINISFPSDLALSKEFYFNENNSYTNSLDENRGNYFLKIRGWLMPDEGIALQLSAKNSNSLPTPTPAPQKPTGNPPPAKSDKKKPGAESA